MYGTHYFHNIDDGANNLALFYSVDDSSRTALVERPFLCGRLYARNFDARYDAAMDCAGLTTQKENRWPTSYCCSRA